MSLDNPRPLDEILSIMETVGAGGDRDRESEHVAGDNLLLETIHRLADGTPGQKDAARIVAEWQEKSKNWWWA